MGKLFWKVGKKVEFGLHIGYNHYRVGTKTIAVEPRDVIQLSMSPQPGNENE